MSALTHEAWRAVEVELSPEQLEERRRQAEKILGRQLPRHDARWQKVKRAEPIWTPPAAVSDPLGARNIDDRSQSKRA